MKIKSLLLISLILLTICSCNRAISDRIGPLNENDLLIQVDTFQIHKKVRFELETETNFDFEDCKIQILINSAKVVFMGTYSELKKSIIPLPRPMEYANNDSSYLIGVTVYDLENKLEYRWASDVAYFLDAKRTNKIKLLYTGIPEESITLRVE
jgi:hypothetical protein